VGYCRFHPKRESFYDCTVCGAPICPLCTVDIAREHYCLDCARKKRASMAAAQRRADAHAQQGAPARVNVAELRSLFTMLLVVPLIAGCVALFFCLRHEAPPVPAEVMVEQEGRRYGPYDDTTVRSMYRQGRFTPRTRVERGGEAMRPILEAYPDLRTAGQQ